MKSPTALLLFSRSATAEAAGKKIFSSGKQNKKAVSGLIDNSLLLAKNSGLTWYLSDERSQKQKSFGEKLSKAVRDIFAYGHQKVLVVGNDCPGLTLDKLQHAITLLEEQDWVLGPTPKGGIYLFGVSATSFDETVFEQISWQTGMVFRQLLQQIRQRGSGLACVDMLNDINNEKDILSLRNKLSLYNPVARFLLGLVQSATRFFRLPSSAINWSFNRSVNNRRGPPPGNNERFFCLSLI